MTSKLALSSFYPKVRKGVDDIMGGKILEHEAKSILQRGIREGELRGEIKGETKGKAKGRLEMCLELVREGILSLSDAAKRLNMKEEELKAYLQ